MSIQNSKISFKLSSLDTEVFRDEPLEVPFSINAPYMDADVPEKHTLYKDGTVEDVSFYEYTFDSSAWKSFSIAYYDTPDNIILLDPPSLTITGRDFIYYKYKVSIVDTGLVLKDYTTLTKVDIINDSVIISPDYLTKYTPYTIEVYVEYDNGNWTKNSTQVHIQDNAPTITNQSYSFGQILSTIDDLDNDKVRYRVKLNGNVIYPIVGNLSFSDYFTPPIDYSQHIETDWNFYKVGKNNSNNVIVEVEDIYGKATISNPITFDGEYLGLIFKDETGSPYSTDKGSGLKTLLTNDIVSGTESKPQKIIIQNLTGKKVINLTLTLDKTSMSDFTDAKLSKDKIDYEDSIIFVGELENGSSFEFYTKIITGMDSYDAGAFFINVSATPVDENNNIITNNFINRMEEEYNLIAPPRFNQIYYAIDDAYVDEDSYILNFGTEPLMYVGATGDINYRSFVKFDISTMPKNMRIMKATLQLQIVDVGSSYEDLEISEVTQKWSETGITWLSQPTKGNLIDIINIDTYAKTLNIKLLDVVRKWYSGTSINQGIVLKAYDELINATKAFYTKEYGDGIFTPKLIIEYYNPESLIFNTTMLPASVHVFEEMTPSLLNCSLIVNSFYHEDFLACGISVGQYIECSVIIEQGVILGRIITSCIRSLPSTVIVQKLQPKLLNCSISVNPVYLQGGIDVAVSRLLNCSIQSISQENHIIGDLVVAYGKTLYSGIYVDAKDNIIIGQIFVSKGNPTGMLTSSIIVDNGKNINGRVIVSYGNYLDSGVEAYNPSSAIYGTLNVDYANYLASELHVYGISTSSLNCSVSVYQGIIPCSIVVSNTDILNSSINPSVIDILRSSIYEVVGYDWGWLYASFMCSYASRINGRISVNQIYCIGSLHVFTPDNSWIQGTILANAVSMLSGHIDASASNLLLSGIDVRTKKGVILVCGVQVGDLPNRKLGYAYIM